MKVEDIEKIACVGAGTIGRSWALLFAHKGYSVNLYDIKDQIVHDALDCIRSDLLTLVGVKVVTKKEADAAFERIKGTTNLAEAVRSVDFVQESVSEKLNIKKKVFKEISELCPEHSILASSSSSLSPTRISEDARRPERCIVAHPFNPPHLIPLVELVLGAKTSDDTVKVAREFFLKLGKRPVVVRKYIPGYLVNRIQMALFRECVDLVNNGIASVEDIDVAVSAGPGLRWALMGPFLIFQLGGGDQHEMVKFRDIMEDMFKDLAKWIEFPSNSAEKCVEGVKAEIGLRDIREIAKWRDKKIIEFLKILGQI